MKQCPSCRTTYTDETLRFCLADGATLNDLADEQQTVVRQAPEPMRVNIPQPTETYGATQTFPQAPVRTAGGSSGNGLKILLVILLVAILSVAVLGVGAFVYLNSGRKEIASNTDNVNTNRSGSPTASPMVSPISNQTDNRDQRIADLEKQLKEQKNANRSANTTTQPAMTGTARVNSPGDGFLALRSLPSSSVGERILKIPHGATVSVGSCLGGNRGGRWCRASYGGYSGWVYDSYLIY